MIIEMSPAGLREILGDADLKTTAIYAKVFEGLVRAEAKRIQGLREGPDFEM